MKKGRFIWGTALIGASCLLLADLFNVLPKGINWFSMTVTMLLILTALWSVLRKRFSEAVMPLTFAVILNMRALNINGNVWSVLLVGILLSIGLSMIFPKPYFFMGADACERTYRSKGGSNMHISSVFGSRSRKINSDSLRYLEIESVFGSLDLYCNDAMIEDGAVIKLENVFSTTRIYFDKDVRVISNMTNVFAGLRDDQSSYQAQGPTVVLRGENVFGGVEIIYL